MSLPRRALLLAAVATAVLVSSGSAQMRALRSAGSILEPAPAELWG